MGKISNFNVAVIGAGPAGLFAVGELAKHNIQVAVINRDIRPGGLAEYGIYPEKLRLKLGLREQFTKILDCPNVKYFGNVTIGRQGDLSLEDIQSLGFHAILVTVGAQGTKWLGLPGEDLHGVYHAKDLVYHYNLLPPFSELQFSFGKRAIIIGAGSVMTDISHYLFEHKNVKQVTVIARRGPGEVKFGMKELQLITPCMNNQALINELEMAAPIMAAIGQDVDQISDDLLAKTQCDETTKTNLCFTIKFLLSTTRIIGNENNQVVGIELEENILKVINGMVTAVGTGRTTTLDTDSIIFAIGDKADADFGLPMHGFEFAKNPDPRIPINGESYEVFNPARGKPFESIFIAGWARQASKGAVGIARRDGANAAHTVIQYLDTLQTCDANPEKALQDLLCQTNKPVVFKEHIKQLDEIESEKAVKQGLEFFKFGTNQEMLDAMGFKGNKQKTR